MFPFSSRRKFMILFFCGMKKAFHYRRCNFHLNIWIGAELEFVLCFMLLLRIRNFIQLISAKEATRKDPTAEKLFVSSGFYDPNCPWENFIFSLLKKKISNCYLYIKSTSPDVRVMITEKSDISSFWILIKILYQADDPIWI